MASVVEKYWGVGSVDNLEDADIQSSEDQCEDGKVPALHMGCNVGVSYFAAEDCA